MKIGMRIIFYTVLSFFLSDICFGQASRKASSQGEIEIATTKLHLGMTKGEVTEKLAGVEIQKLQEDFWLIKTPSSQTLQFINGKLSYADRYWTTYDNDVVEALYGAVSYLNMEGYYTCRVSTDSKIDPTSTLHRIWIQCGEKGILIVRGTVEKSSYSMIYETLGNMHPNK